MHNDPTVLGQLLFRMLDLDRVTLGDYSSRRTSKAMLKVFIGCFGFDGKGALCGKQAQHVT